MIKTQFLSRGKINVFGNFGEWISGYYIPKNDQYGYIYTGKIIITRDELKHQSFPVDPKTVGRFTGLTDKDGVKIFEGDIVSVNHPYNGESTHEVIWDEYCWNLKNFRASCFEYPSMAFSEGTEYMTVVGNIHDNPELLKSKERK